MANTLKALFLIGLIVLLSRFVDFHALFNGESSEPVTPVASPAPKPEVSVKPSKVETNEDNENIKRQQAESLEVAKTFVLIYFSYHHQKLGQNLEKSLPLMTPEYIQLTGGVPAREKAELIQRDVQILDAYVVEGDHPPQQMIWDIAVRKTETVQVNGKTQKLASEAVYMVRLKQVNDKWFVDGVEVSYGQ
ncbi:hypothetical protein [Ammoniphilus sp. 3BR4]|uniref:hypothetical protein n=1 Tax=Ammoniphilus sp. 3BR4 TaxID=3158265 RepID=UPI003466280D